MIKQHYTYLDLYAIFLRLLSVGAVVIGLVVVGILIYFWGQLEGYYTVLRTALLAMSSTSPELGPVLQLPDLPLWPLILALLAVLGLMAFAALTFWAIGSYISLKLTLADEERESRRIQRKAIEGALQSLKVPSKT